MFTSWLAFASGAHTATATHAHDCVCEPHSTLSMTARKPTAGFSELPRATAYSTVHANVMAVSTLQHALRSHVRVSLYSILYYSSVCANVCMFATQLKRWRDVVRVRAVCSYVYIIYGSRERREPQTSGPCGANVTHHRTHERRCGLACPQFD